MQPDGIHNLQLALLRAIAAHARQDVLARFEERNGKKAYRPVSVPLTDDSFDYHLRCVQPLGVYLMKGGTTRMGVIDIDDHDGERAWGEVVTVARRITAELERQGRKWVAFRSGGGNGIHIFVLFDIGIPAWMLRQELGDAIEAAGLTVGTRGVAAGEVEIFPKQDSVDADGFGSLIALPLSRQSTGLDENFNPVPYRADAIAAWMPRMFAPLLRVF
jgi:hypothetical protein